MHAGGLLRPPMLVPGLDPDEGGEVLGVQLGDAAHVAGDVFVILESTIQDQLEHRGEQRRVFARLHLEVNVGHARHIRSPRLEIRPVQSTSPEAWRRGVGPK